jgi:putative membrane protein
METMMAVFVERLKTCAMTVAVTALTAAPALAQGPGAGAGPGSGAGPGPWGYGHPMMRGWGDGRGGWMVASGFMHLLALIGVIAVVLAIVRLFRHGHCPYHRRGGSDGQAIIEGRYARGEIGRDEYLEKKRDLGGR